MSFQPNPAVLRASARIERGRLRLDDAEVLSAYSAPEEKNPELTLEAAYLREGTQLGVRWWQLERCDVAGLVKLRFKGRALTETAWTILDRKSCKEEGDAEALALYHAFVTAERIHLEVRVAKDKQADLTLDLRYRTGRKTGAPVKAGEDSAL